MLPDLRRFAATLLAQGAARCSEEQWAVALEAAVAQYSRDRPRRVVEDIALATAWRLPLPSAWADDSTIISVEALPASRPPITVDAQVVPTPTGPEIWLSLGHAGDVMRVAYNAPHVVTDTQDTTPARDREPIACWVAAILSDALAAAAADNSAPTIQADSADTANPAREWGARAKALRARYAAMLGVQGISGGSGSSGTAGAYTPPAGVVVDLDRPPSSPILGGRRRR